MAKELLEVIKSMYPGSLPESFAKAKQKLQEAEEELLADLDPEAPSEEQFMASASTAYDALGEAAFLALATRQRFCLRSGCGRLVDVLPEQLGKAEAFATVQESLSPLQAATAQDARLNSI